MVRTTMTTKTETETPVAPKTPAKSAAKKTTKSVSKTVAPSSETPAAPPAAPVEEAAAPEIDGGLIAQSGEFLTKLQQVSALLTSSRPSIVLSRRSGPALLLLPRRLTLSVSARPAPALPVVS